MNQVATTEAASVAAASGIVAVPMGQEAPRQLAVTPASESARLIHVIAAAASDPTVDIDKMERLWVMHEKLSNKAQEEAFNSAMNMAQREMGRVSADAANQQTRSVYATYGKLDRAVRPIYTKHGFSLSFDTGEGAPEGCIRVLAYVSHSAGHTRTYRADMPADGKGAKGNDVMTKTHASGAAMSYGMRYLLKLIFNIAIGEDDTDGNDPAPGGNQNPLANLLDELLAQLGGLGTNAEVMAWWKAENAKLAADATLHGELKAAVEAHRKKLRDAALARQQAQQGAAA